MAGVGVALTLPQVVLAARGGVVSDRVDRRLLMLTADVVRAGTLGVLGVLALSGQLELWQLYVGHHCLRHGCRVLPPRLRRARAGGGRRGAARGGQRPRPVRPTCRAVAARSRARRCSGRGARRRCRVPARRPHVPCVRDLPDLYAAPAVHAGERGAPARAGHRPWHGPGAARGTPVRRRGSPGSGRPSSRRPSPTCCSSARPRCCSPTSSSTSSTGTPATSG